MNMNFFMPTRVVSGPDCLKENAQLLKTLGTKAFIMTGRSSARKNGSLADTEAALKAAGMSWDLFDRVTPNPSLELVREAADQARKAGADCVIAIGGGSPIDAAKAVAVLVPNENISDQELLSMRVFPAVLPLAAVPTTAGTGSEVTPYSILTNNAQETKSFLVTDQIFPCLAFMDGRYMLDLPREITVNTAVDAISHAVEGFLAVRRCETGRAFALAALSVIGKVLPALLADKTLSLEDRDNLLYGSMLAGIVIAQSGTTAVHALGYSLTYFKGIDHGLANGLLMAAYLKFLYKERSGDVEAVLNALNISTLDDFASAMKQLLPPLSISKEEIEKFAAIAVTTGNVANTEPRPSESELAEIYRTSFTVEDL